MTLFWPGDERAAGLFSPRAVLAAMLNVEAQWSHALVVAGIAPAAAHVALTGIVDDVDIADLAAEAEAGGNPVVPLLTLVRTRLRDRGHDDAARWLHRGLTSQDVVDTAFVLCARDTCRTLQRSLRHLVVALADLAEAHRATSMVGRTLTQPAVPIRFGAKVAGWLHGVLDAATDLDHLTFPAQFGGAAGTLSGATVLTGGDAAAALELARSASTALGLDAAPPWHTHRAPVTRTAEAFARCTAACGRIANDVLTLTRPELGELAEAGGDGVGGSSTMPQKHNPVLSVLIRRAALAAPALVSTLLLAAADARDERPDGAWHLEWEPLHLLARHTVTAADQTVEVVTGLQVDVDRMAANLAAAEGMHAERDGLAAFVGTDVGDVWCGADDALIDAATARAAAWLGAAV